MLEESPSSTQDSRRLGPIQPDRRHNLPAPFTSLVGRQRDLQEVRSLMGRARLVTLTGPGGCGKTSLALEIAGLLVDQYRDGVWLVELADLQYSALLPQTVAEALEVLEKGSHSPMDDLVRALAQRRLCLVLDNCEHLVSACASLTHTLLQACPGIKVLASSRQSLGIIGEIVYPVPPLACPSPGNGTGSPEEMVRAPAVQLFVERARQCQVDFQLTPVNATAVANICCRLDGIPLAIELATARVNTLTPEELAAMLDDRFSLLTRGSPTAPPRHQTLRATMEWSYQLLTPPEQVLLRRLSVFVGGWDLEAAREVCSDTDGPPPGRIASAQVLDLLSNLVSKSWVIADRGVSGTRYRFLETTQEYAAELLEESGEIASLRQRHASCILALAERAFQEFPGAEMALWLSRLEEEEQNLRAALGWAVMSRESEVGVRLGAALWPYWYIRGYTREGVEWLDLVLDLDPKATSQARTNALYGASGLVLGDLDRSEAYLKESIFLSRELDDVAGMARGMMALGLVEFRQGNCYRAVDLLGQAVTLCHQIGDPPWIVGMGMGALGAISQGSGEHGPAEELLRAGLQRLGDLSDMVGIALVLEDRARAAMLRGDLKAGSEAAIQSLVASREIGEPKCVAGCLEMLANVEAAQGRLRRAACLAGAAAGLRDSIAIAVYPADLPHHEQTMATLRAGLRPVDLDDAWAQGLAMDQRTAIAYALDQEAVKVSSFPDGLSQREVEVLRLIAQGKTNRQIAADLSISLHTVANHVQNILNKTGAANRTEAAAYASRQGLM